VTTAAPDALTRRSDRPPHLGLARRIAPTEDQKVGRGPERLGEAGHRRASGVQTLTHDLSDVTVAREATELANRLEIEPGQLDYVSQTFAEGIHDARTCADARSHVKDEALSHRASPRFSGDNSAVPSAKPKEQTSPVADRIRARLAELNLSETEAAKRLGWTRTVLSSLLRRLDSGQGESLRDDTIAKLELVLAKPAQWIRTGVEPEGVRLADCPGWTEAAAQARDRYNVDPHKIAEIGESRVPRPLRYVEASWIRDISDAF